VAVPADILRALPHREPFRFVSAIEELSPGVSGRGVWSVTGREDFLAGHFPGQPIVPGVLIGEALAQLAGLVGLHGMGQDVEGRLARIDLRFDRAVVPPAEVVLLVSVTRGFGALTEFEARAECGGLAAARGTITLATAAAKPQEERTT
jgi:3-hydroxyacyl-[acyl-carrier-protein] dehydratase